MADTVHLKNDYSKLNEALIKLFDESGVKRSFTVPYINGQEMSEHINSVGTAAKQTGGLSKNLVMSAHHSSGKGWGSDEGHTVGHASEKLRQTMIPKDDANAKAAIAAAQKMVTNLKFLLGDDDPTVQTAQGHLNLVKPTQGAGMSLFDFGSLLIAALQKPIQAASRAHSGTKPGGHTAQPRGPIQAAPAEGQEAPGGAQTGGEASTGSQAAPGAQEASQAAPGAPEAAPAPAQA
jgi:hypothetical protein